MGPVPDTVTEAVAMLAADGYRDEVRLEGGGLWSRDAGGTLPLHDVVIDHTFRFEGPSDPADEAIVIGLRCPELGVKGVLISAFGPDADPEHAELLRSLASLRR